MLKSQKGEVQKLQSDSMRKVQERLRKQGKTT